MKNKKEYDLKFNIPQDGIVRIYTDDARKYLSAGFEASYDIAKNAEPNTDVQQSFVYFSGKYCKHFVVRVSRTEDFAEYFDRDVYAVCAADEYGVNLRTLIPGEKYYAKVFDYDDESICSDVYSFTAENLTARTLNLLDENGKGTLNARDSGGYAAENGKKVKYEMLYRGIRLNARFGESDACKLGELRRKILKNELKIKTEIDLRASGIDDFKFEDPNKTPQTKNEIDESLQYAKCTVTQYDLILDESKKGDSEEGLRKVFAILAEKENYPVYIHCNAGADRTGSVYMLIHGLLGVSFEDATRDYELTSFSSLGKRLRDDCFQNNESNYIAWGNFYKAILKYSEKGDFNEGAKNYLLSIGVTEKQINSVKAILLK